MQRVEDRREISEHGTCGIEGCRRHLVAIKVKGGKVWICPVHDNEKEVREFYE
jgi:predicted NUDIX family NTP pyrophosphohydrolase